MKLKKSNPDDGPQRAWNVYAKGWLDKTGAATRAHKTQAMAQEIRDLIRLQGGDKNPPQVRQVNESIGSVTVVCNTDFASRLQRLPSVERVEEQRIHKPVSAQRPPKPGR
ncbi:MAG: hypothetical protein OXT65_08140 [Alphaproteobacteria bacterium]|nr:hypothetical protein [Alphaproteobacteria bacterium]